MDKQNSINFVRDGGYAGNNIQNCTCLVPIVRKKSKTTQRRYNMVVMSSSPSRFKILRCAFLFLLRLRLRTCGIFGVGTLNEYSG